MTIEKLIISFDFFFVSSGNNYNFFGNALWNLKVHKMNSDGSDEEVDINENDRNIPEKFHSEFISGWENDDEGIEEEEHPHGKPSRFFSHASYSSWTICTLLFVASHCRVYRHIEDRKEIELMRILWIWISLLFYYVTETPEKEILWAAENGNAELVRKLLSIDGNLTKCVDKDGYTPLHRAAYSNHLDVLNVSNSDINKPIYSVIYIVLTKIPTGWLFRFCLNMVQITMQKQSTNGLHCILLVVGIVRFVWKNCYPWRWMLTHNLWEVWFCSFLQ